MMKRAALSVICLSAAIASFANANDERQAEGSVVRQDGPWTIAETKHFEVWCHLGPLEAARLCKHCEALRANLGKVWLEGVAPPEWNARCSVVLSQNIAAYGQAVGSPGNSSVGCTTLQVRHGKVTFRRIDLRADAPSWRTSALAHEMTHVVLADRFAGKPLPLWADEGLSVLSEPESTRLKRGAALNMACRDGRTCSLTALLAQTDMPEPRLRDSFYSQSALLVALLIDQATPARFLEFLERSQRVGIDAALRDIYRIDGRTALAVLWRRQMQAASRGALTELTERAALAVHVNASSLPVSAQDR